MLGVGYVGAEGWVAVRVAVRGVAVRGVALEAGRRSDTLAETGHSPNLR